MKVLLDENLTATFERKLRELLEPEGASIHSVNEEGWAGYQNGELMAAMGGTGFTHMITYDKRMSGQTVPSVPVMLLDARSPGEPDEVARARDIANARAVAERLAHDPPDRADYYGVVAEGFPPSKKLRAVLAGDYRMHADRIADRLARGESVEGRLGPSAFCPD